MSMRQVRAIEVRSEFAPGQTTGRCTEDGFMSARHSVDPSHPVSEAELERLAGEAEATGEAGGSGDMRPDQLAWLCQHEGVPFHQLITPNWQDYSQFTAWQEEVRAWGGIKPMIVQVGHGEWLPDSWSSPTGPAVGHAVALLGYDPASGDVLLGDGNSSTGGNGQTTRCPWATLVRAQPYALTVLDVQVPDSGTNAGGAPVTISDQNMGQGFKAYADAHTISAPNTTGGEVFDVIDGSYTAWADAVVLFYRADVGVRDNMAGHVVGQLTAKVRALLAEVGTLQTQLAAAKAAPPATPPAAPASDPVTADKAHRYDLIKSALS